MTLKDVVMTADAERFSLPLFVSVNGEAALPVRSVALDDGRLILSNKEKQPYDV